MAKKTTAIKTPALSFSRISTTEQKEGKGLDRQGDAITNQSLLDRYNLYLDDNLTLEGVSAFRGKNLEILLEILESKEYPKDVVPTLIVEEWSRFSRACAWSVFPIVDKIVNKLGWRILIAFPETLITKDWLDSETNVMLLTAWSLGASSQSKNYSKNTATNIRLTFDRIRQGKADGDKRHIVLTSRVTYGLTTRRIVGGRKHGDFIAGLDPAVAPTIKEIFKRILKGQSSMDVYRWLVNDEPCKPPMGNRWAESTVRAIIANRSYIGEYQPCEVVYVEKNGKKKRQRIPKGEPIKNYFPAIVSEKDFELCQAQMASRKTTDSTPHHNKAGNLLTGLLKCPSCGSSMVRRMVIHRKTVRHFKLQCSKKCRWQGLPPEIAEATVVNGLMEYLEKPILKKQDQRTKDIEKQIGTLTASITDLEKKVENFNQKMDWADDKADYQRHKANRDAVKAKLESAIGEKSELIVSLGRSDQVEKSRVTLRNSLEDIALQAVLGIQGKFLFDGKHAGTSLDQVDPLTKEDLRLKMISMIDGLVKSAMIHDNGETVIILKTGDVVKTKTLDPAKNPSETSEAFGSMFLRWLAVRGTQDAMRPARLLLAQMDYPDEIKAIHHPRRRFAGSDEGPGSARPGSLDWWNGHPEGTARRSSTFP